MKRKEGAARFAEKNTTRTMMNDLLNRVEIFLVATAGYLARRKCRGNIFAEWLAE